MASGPGGGRAFQSTLRTSLGITSQLLQVFTSPRDASGSQSIQKYQNLGVGVAMDIRQELHNRLIFFHLHLKLHTLPQGIHSSGGVCRQGLGVPCRESTLGLSSEKDSVTFMAR